MGYPDYPKSSIIFVVCPLNALTVFTAAKDFDKRRKQQNPFPAICVHGFKMYSGAITRDSCDVIG